MRNMMSRCSFLRARRVRVPIAAQVSAVVLCAALLVRYSCYHFIELDVGRVNAIYARGFVGIAWNYGQRRPAGFSSGTFDPALAPEWIPTIGHSGELAGATLPLWMIAIAVAALLCLFERSSHRAPVGQSCRNCGYDLRGTSSGRCSECGAIRANDACRARDDCERISP